MYIVRELDQERQDRFENDLAASLLNLSHRLGDVGRRESALLTVGEAVSIYRSIKAANPDRGHPARMAEALAGLSSHLAALGQREPALAAIEEAIVLYESVAAANPRRSPRPLEDARDRLRSLRSADG